MKKIQASISIWGLLMASKKHRQNVLDALKRSHIPIDTTPEELVAMILLKPFKPIITFTNDDLLPEGPSHNKPRYVIVKCLGNNIPVCLVKNGSVLNVCPYKTTVRMGLN